MRNMYLIVLVVWGFLCIHKVHAQNEPVNQAAAYLRESGMRPDKYLLSKFDDADVILLAEDHAVKENLLFIHHLIPQLYKRGIRLLGMEFGAAEDQSLLDSLLVAPEFNESVACEIMRNYNVMWPVKEYMEVYRAAWKLNRSLPAAAPKFRILNISYRYNWRGFYGVREPENMKKVFYKGNPEVFRMGILEKEVLSQSEKVLVLTGTPHAFTHYRFPRYDYTAIDFVSYECRDLGNLLYRKYGDRVLSVILHQPFPNYPDRNPALASPAKGDIEAVFRKIGNEPMGFDLQDTPLGKLPDASYYSMGYPEFTLSQLADGYIFLKPIHELSSCSADLQFTEGKSWEEVLDNVPDPDWHNSPQSPEEYWKVVYDLLDIPKRYQMFY